MNDKDKEALYDWIDNDALSPDEITLFRGMSEQERVVFVTERTWQAACEFKDAQLQDGLKGACPTCEVVAIKSQKLDKEIDDLKQKLEAAEIAYISNQKAAVLSATLGDKLEYERSLNRALVEQIEELAQRVSDSEADWIKLREAYDKQSESIGSAP
jgi:hypothetical protein